MTSKTKMSLDTILINYWSVWTAMQMSDFMFGVHHSLQEKTTSNIRNPDKGIVAIGCTVSNVIALKRRVEHVVG